MMLQVGRVRGQCARAPPTRPRTGLGCRLSRGRRLFPYEHDPIAHTTPTSSCRGAPGTPRRHHPHASRAKFVGQSSSLPSTISGGSQSDSLASSSQTRSSQRRHPPPRARRGGLSREHPRGCAACHDPSDDAHLLFLAHVAASAGCVCSLTLAPTPSRSRARKHECAPV